MLTFEVSGKHVDTLHIQLIQASIVRKQILNAEDVFSPNLFEAVFVSQLLGVRNHLSILRGNMQKLLTLRESLC